MRVFVPLLILFLSTSLGCPIMDELNAANEKMDILSNTKPDEEEEVAEGEKFDPLERSKEWWDKAKSLNRKQLSPSIVSCRFRSGTQFMSRDDCLGRGGQPKSV